MPIHNWTAFDRAEFRREEPTPQAQIEYRKCPKCGQRALRGGTSYPSSFYVACDECPYYMHGMMMAKAEWEKAKL